MSEAFIAHLQDLMGDLGAVSARRMFGGHGLYLDGVMIGIVIEEALYLKTDAQTRSRFEAAGGAAYVYLSQRQPVTMSYWSVPAEALESAPAMRPWAQLALAAALRKRPAPRRR